MNQISINRIPSGIVGFIIAAILGITQETLAATVFADSTVIVQNSTATLDGIDITPLFSNTIEGAVSIGPGQGNGNNGSYSGGPETCPTFLSDRVDRTKPNRSASAISQINCSGGITEILASANTEITGNNRQSDSSSEYNIVSDPFLVQAGQVFDFSGIVSTSLTVGIEDFGKRDIATVTSSFEATYEIFLNDELVFAGPVLANSINLENENGTETFALTLPFDALGVDYTFANDGLATVEFFGLREVSARISRNSARASNSSNIVNNLAISPTATPEPLTILGTMTAASFGAFFKQKLNQRRSNIN